jgi:hypothetical protein
MLTRVMAAEEQFAPTGELDPYVGLRTTAVAAVMSRQWLTVARLQVGSAHCGVPLHREGREGPGHLSMVDVIASATPPTVDFHTTASLRNLV